MPGSAAHTFADPHAFADAIGMSDVDIVVTKPGRFQGDLTGVRLHRLALLEGRLSLPVIARTAQRADQGTLFFLAGADQAPVHASGKELAPGELAQAELGGEHHLRLGAGCHFNSLYLSAADLAAASQALLGRELGVPGSARFIRPPAAAMQRLRRLHGAGSQLAASAPDVVAHPEVAKAIEAALVHAMVDCLGGGTVTQAFDRQSQNRVMRRLEQELEGCPGQPIYLEELCARIGVSERVLRRICNERLGIGPQRYLWLRRMHLARQALLLGDAGTTRVTGVAVGCGFGELGRFAVQYRALFGETPSTTLRRPPDQKGATAGSRRDASLSVLTIA